MSRTDRIKKELSETVNNVMYNGWSNRNNGYNSYNIEEIDIVGQRNTLMRVNLFKKYINLKNKNVIDFGCNTGAILQHIPELKKGIGFDYDSKCIIAANNINEILNIDNLFFYKHDFDKDSYDKLKEKIDIKPDFIFLLSLGSWVNSWGELYSFSLIYNCDIILEINNIEEGREQLEFFENNNCKIELIIDNSLDDNTGNNNRKTYLIKPYGKKR